MISRKFINIFSLLFIISLAWFLSPQEALAETRNSKVWPAKEMSVAPNKIWTIRFNSDLTSEKASDSIIVTDSEGNEVNVKITQVDRKAISIEPPIGGYFPGELYDLSISDSLKSNSNQPLRQPISMKFKIDRNETLEMEFNKQVIEVENENVTMEGPDTLTINNTALDEPLVNGDIIKLPPSEENPLGLVKKVISKNENENTTTIETVTPEVNEIFSDLEVYQKVPITAEHISDVPEQISIRNVKILQSSSKDSVRTDATFEPIPNIKAKWDSGIEVEFNHFLVKTKSGLPIYLDGKLIYKAPVAEFDHKLKKGKLERFNVELMTVTEEQLTVSLGVRGDFSLEDIHKQLKREDFESTVKVGNVTVPIGSTGLGAVVELGFFLQGDFKGDVFATVSRNTELTLGAIAENGNVTPIFNYEPDLGFKLGGRGEAKVETGGYLNVYLVFANILQGGLNNRIGLYSDLKSQAAIGTHVEYDLDEGFDLDPSLACYKYEPGSFIDSTIFAEIELGWFNYEETLLQVTFFEDKNPFDSYVQNNCKELESLFVLEEMIVEPGELKEVFVVGQYYDHYDLLQNYEDLKQNGKWKYIKLESSNPAIVKVVNGRYIQVDPRAVDGDRASIKVTYQEEDIVKTEEISIVIHSDIPTIEQMKKMAESIGYDISRILISGWEDNDDYSQDDFSTLEDDLKEVVTEDYMFGTLKPYYEHDMCYACDSGMFPFSVATDLLFEVLESSSEKLVIKTAELGNELNSGGLITYTFKKQNDKWLLDDYRFQVFSAVNKLGVTAEQAEQYLESYYTNTRYYNYNEVSAAFAYSGTETSYDWYTDSYYLRTYYVLEVDTDKDQFKVKFYSDDGFFYTNEFWEFSSLSTDQIEKEQVNIIELLPNGQLLVEKDGQQMNVHINNIKLASQDELRELLTNAEKIELEFDIIQRDSKGNLLAYVYADGTLVNEWLIQNGYAHLHHIHANTRYMEQLVESQKEAKASKLGLWENSEYSFDRY
ncbi:thermonuclease family protein [Bacillus dakarensis]|uniref:thermonuclease family protein n=1 Tax=Robertmurraya dakarensis TaxID=1926278 RepID=UPI000980BC32|nr:thermonuclease family protein [Bacillus dakarensis]